MLILLDYAFLLFIVNNIGIFQEMTNLHNYFKFAIAAVIFGFMSVILVFCYCYNKQFEANALKVKQFYIQKKKKDIKEKVDSLIYTIDKRQKSYERSVERKLRYRVANLYFLTYSIYNKYKNIKSQDEIKKIILEYIYNMDLYNSGKGLFFVGDLKGNEIFSPDKSIIGKNLLKDRNYAMAQEIETVKTKTEGFVENCRKKNVKKEKRVEFIKLFEPFKWYLGAGEYLDNYELLQQDIIYELHSYTYEFHKHGYFFIIKLKDINNPNCFGYEEIDPNTPELIGECLSIKTPDSKGFLYRKKYLNDIKNRGYSFVEYYYQIPKTNKIGKKLVYLTLYKPFNWIIGTGVYVDDLEYFILNLKKDTKAGLVKSLTNSIVIVVSVFIVVSLIIFILLKRMDKAIKTLSNFVLKYPAQNIDIDKINISHIKLLAENIKKSFDEKSSLHNKLSEEQQRYKQLINNMPYCIIIIKYLNEECRITDANASCSSSIKFPKTKIIGETVEDIFGKNSNILQDIKKVMQNKKGTNSKTTKTEKQRLGYSIYGLYDKEAVLIVWDITQEYSLREALKESEEKFRTFAESAETGILLLSKNGVVKYANPKANHIIEDESEGYNLLSKAADEHKLSIKNTFEKTLLGRKEQRRIDVKIVIDNKEKWITMSFNKIHINKEPHVLIFCLDITDIFLHKQKLEYISYHDPLTNIYNRRFFNEEMKRMFNKRSAPFGLIIMDLDGLKIVNDVLGHSEGDSVIKRFADILKSSIRQNDILARIGGDEFVIIAPNTDEDGIKTQMQRIEKKLEKDNEENDICINFSYGCAVEDKNFESYTNLFMEADRILYVEKHKKSRKEKLRTILSSVLKNKSITIDKKIEDELINNE